jgi:type IV secretion system protein VirB10
VGSYVEGTVTQAKRPGRVKGRGELYIRFDSLTLPNGVMRDFHASISQLDGMSSDDLDKREGKVKSPTNKGGDVRTIGEAAAGGASIGSIAGAVSGHPGMGAGIGAAAGAAAGLIGVLLTRGPDAVLERGSTMEMVLDRRLEFSNGDMDYSKAPPQAQLVNGPGPGGRNNSTTTPIRRFPF